MVADYPVAKHCVRDVVLLEKFGEKGFLLLVSYDQAADPPMPPHKPPRAFPFFDGECDAFQLPFLTHFS